MTVGTPMTSAASRAEIRFLTACAVGRSTLPPMWPHFFSLASWSSKYAAIAGTAQPGAAWQLGVGLFLLGLGWSCGLIAGSTLVTEAVGEPAGPFVTRFSELVGRLAADHRVGAQIWIQGFRMEPSDAADIRAAVAAARAAGVEDLWTWGFEACGHMSALAGGDPAAVWAVLRDALTGR